MRFWDIFEWEVKKIISSNYWIKNVITFIILIPEKTTKFSLLYVVLDVDLAETNPCSIEFKL